MCVYLLSFTNTQETIMSVLCMYESSLTNKIVFEMSKYNDKQKIILVFLFYSIGQKIISFTDK